MRLKELRKNSHKTQEEMAALIGLTRGAYANIENGRREPDFDALNKFADFFGVSVDYLIGRDEQTPKPIAEASRDGLTAEEASLLRNFRELNEEGQEKMLDYADDLVQSGKYKNRDTVFMGAQAASA